MAGQPLTAEQLQNLVQAAVQAAIAANPAPPAVPPVVPPPPAGPFARSPANAMQNEIDYSTSAGAKIYGKATAELPTLFSLQKPNVRVLLNELDTRALGSGWQDILMVDVNHGVAGAAPLLKNLVTDHGQIQMQQCQEFSKSYLHSQTRQSQNNFQLYMCLTNSVDPDTKKVMANEINQYTFKDAAGANPLPCGASYLKLLLSKAELDTRALGSLIRTNLTKLDEYMVHEAKNDIQAFNEYVREQLKLLTSRGEQTTDTLTNLFQGYLACSDEKFVSYIEKLQEEYEDGSDITAEVLMTKAEKKYQTRTLTSNWNAPSKDQEQIIALRAQLKALQQRGRKPSKGKSTGKSSEANTKKSRNKSSKASFEGKFAWRKVAPKAGEPWIKEFEGDNWQWCKHHAYWANHHSDQCRKAKREAKAAKTAKGPKTPDIVSSMAAVGIEDFEESDGENE